MRVQGSGFRVQGVPPPPPGVGASQREGVSPPREGVAPAPSQREGVAPPSMVGASSQACGGWGLGFRARKPAPIRQSNARIWPGLSCMTV